MSVAVTNTGARDGEEVVQVYVGMQHSRMERQKKLLKGFQKMAIPAGATVIVHISIPFDELRYYDAQTKTWRLETGTYRVWVGPSADDRTLIEADPVTLAEA